MVKQLGQGKGKGQKNNFLLGEGTDPGYQYNNQNRP